MLCTKKEVATLIMNLISSNDFEIWYERVFELWVEGADNAPTDNDILVWIMNHIKV